MKCWGLLTLTPTYAGWMPEDWATEPHKAGQDPPYELP